MRAIIINIWVWDETLFCYIYRPKKKRKETVLLWLKTWFYSERKRVGGTKLGCGELVKMKV